MRRIAAIVVLLAGLGAFVVLSTGAGKDSDAGRYWVEFDNAFGLIKGGDLKVAGVRAGKITDIRLDRPSNRALVGFTIDQDGFGSLRRDVRCESRPQSLIGEYFVDCRPGTAKEELKPGARIPVAQTASTVAPDLVNNIMRRPYRERLSLIIGSLGAGVAGNSEALNETIRRAVPALRETDKVLATLAEQNRVLRDLTVNADEVIGDLAANKHDVGRFVTEARETAQASAARRRDIAAGFRKLPTFLRELRPTMTSLGRVADDQGEALGNLSASSKRLTEFFDLLGPFSEASRPAVKTLGKASQKGREAVRKAGPTVQLLNGFAQGVPELGNNLGRVLGHLDSREHAVEKDPRSPGGQGYTGLEALLTYVMDQTMSIAIYDQNGHILKVGAFESPCADYADDKAAKDDELRHQCGSYLGPNQPGVTTADATELPDEPDEDPVKRAARKRANGDERTSGEAIEPPKAGDEQRDEGSRDAPKDSGSGSAGPVDVPQLLPGQPDLPPLPSVPDLPSVLPDGSTDKADEPIQLPGIRLESRTTTTGDMRLLDYLLAP